MDLESYRLSDTERERTDNLLALIPPDCRGSVLDIGARDGWFSRLLAEQFDHVVALDLEKPSFAYPKVHCTAGDITDLCFNDGEFELVFCAEVLEHIPPNQLRKACAGLQRVTQRYILIGVPFKQDTRIGRTTCSSCGKKIRRGDMSADLTNGNYARCFLCAM